MNRSVYYEEMKTLAQAKRALYGVQSKTINLTHIRQIYKDESIRIDVWNFKSPRIRAAYFCDNNDPSVAVKRGLPKEPKLFALVHELKHHYLDRENLQNGEIQCGDYNAKEITEIGAEVFAAEFIYPEIEMLDLATRLGISAQNCTKEKIVEFKYSCQVPVSYIFLLKRFDWFGYCSREDFKKVQFQKLEESMYGVPFYKQSWFRQRRVRKDTRL